MPKRFDLIIFDWDGTLANSTQMITDCVRAASADAGLAVPEPTVASHVIGLGLHEAIDVLFDKINESQRQHMAERYRYHYHVRDEETPLYDGVLGAITELEKQGFMLAVATGKGRNGLNKSLARSGLAKYFHATRCMDECFSKPHPQMLLELMDELGALPERSLMVGDTSFDLQMAQNAGVPSVGVSYGAHPLANLLPYAPLAHFDQFSKLNQWLIKHA
jgi:phosphoglycolate phosphatase